MYGSTKQHFCLFDRYTIIWGGNVIFWLGLHLLIINDAFHIPMSHLLSWENSLCRHVAHFLIELLAFLLLSFEVFIHLDICPLIHDLWITSPFLWVALSLATASLAVTFFVCLEAGSLCRPCWPWTWRDPLTSARIKGMCHHAWFQLWRDFLSLM